MLFRKQRLVAVIDYDAARFQQRAIDTANGALQFSTPGGDDSGAWPDYLDHERFKRFLRGYDGVNVLARAELRAIPWLMIEALIAQTALRLIVSGSVARSEGFGFLTAVERKVRWLRENAEPLSRALE